MKILLIAGLTMLAAGLLAGLFPASLWARGFAKTSRWSNQMSTMMLGVAFGLTLIGAWLLRGLLTDWNGDRCAERMAAPKRRRRG